MSKVGKFYLIFGIALVVVLMLVELGKPHPIDWSDSFETDSRDPWGLYVFDSEINSLTGNRPIVTNMPSQGIYEYMAEKSDSDSLHQGGESMLLINTSLDRTTAERILDFAARGNTVLISTQYLYNLADTLGFDWSYMEYTANDNYVEDLYERNDTVLMGFDNPSLAGSLYRFDKQTRGLDYFSIYDTLTTTSVGFATYAAGDSLRGCNFIRVRFGQGDIYIHLYPYAFTNYYMLQDDNAQYVAGILSVLPSGKPLFVQDHHHVSGQERSRSPLRFIFEHPPLAAGWRLLLLTVLLFVVMGMRRTQRMIPVVEPPRNTSVDFARTIAAMYFRSGDTAGTAVKKINYLLERVRTEYYLPTDILDEEFAKKLACRLGVQVEQVQELVDRILAIRSSAAPTREEFTELCAMIDRFSRPKAIHGAVQEGVKVM